MRWADRLLEKLETDRYTRLTCGYAVLMPVQLFVSMLWGTFL